MDPINRKKKSRSLLKTFGSYSSMLVLCVVGLLLLVFGGIAPTAREIEQTRERLADRQEELEQQKVLAPVYASLQERINEMTVESLAPAKETPLRLEDFSALPSLFENLASDVGLEFLAATPQLRSMRDGNEALRVDARMRGEYSNMQTLLLQLSTLPSVEGLDGLTIEVTEGGKEIRLTLWLGIG